MRDQAMAKQSDNDEVASEEQDRDIEGGEPAERRNISDSSLRERRVIRRLNDPHLRTYAALARQTCSIWMGLACVYFAIYASQTFGKDKVSTARLFFVGVTMCFMIFTVGRLRSAVSSYLANESQARLAIAIERLAMLLLIISILSVVFGIAHLATFF